MDWRKTFRLVFFCPHKSRDYCGLRCLLDTFPATSPEDAIRNTSINYLNLYGTHFLLIMSLLHWIDQEQRSEMRVLRKDLSNTNNTTYHFVESCDQWRLHANDEMPRWITGVEVTTKFYPAICFKNWFFPPPHLIYLFIFLGKFLNKFYIH